MVREVLAVAFAGEFRGLVPRVDADVHVDRRGFRSTAIYRGCRRIDDRLTAVFAGLFDHVDDPLDVDSRACDGVGLEDAARVELDIVVKILRGAETLVVDHDHVVVFSEVVRQVRTDEARATADDCTVPFVRQ